MMGTSHQLGSPYKAYVGRRSLSASGSGESDLEVEKGDGSGVSSSSAMSQVGPSPFLHMPSNKVNVAIG